jgi:hypothetical protein
LLGEDVGGVATPAPSHCLGLVQLKHEVRREALDVPFDLLDQAFRLHAVQVCEIFIENMVIYEGYS